MKMCSKCKSEKDKGEFYNSNVTKDGLNAWCKDCEKEYRRQRYAQRKASASQSDIKQKECTKCTKTKDIKHFGINFDKADGYDVWCKQCARDALRTPEGKARRMVYTAKRRANDINVPFDIIAADLTVPTHCPILGIPLCFTHSQGGPKDDAPSLDRIVPSRGYVKGNVMVISQRANRIKNDASIEELEAVVNYLKINC